MMEQRAQINQVFLFLVAIIVIIATVYLGGKLLGIFSGTACSAADSSFATELKNGLDANAAYGGRNKITVSSPCDAQELYVVDASAIGGATPVVTGNSQIDALLAANVKTNVFIVKDGAAEAVMQDNRIIVGREPGAPLSATPFVRVEAGISGFSLLVEGFGRDVRVGTP
jgi:hypothetical protein